MRNKFFTIRIFILLCLVNLGCLPGLNRFALDFTTFNFLFGLFNPSVSIGGEVVGLLGDGLRLNLENNYNGSIENEEIQVSRNGGFLFRMVPKEGSTTASAS